MAAGHVQQLWGAAALGLSRGVWVGRFTALRPLGMLLPPQPRPLVMCVRGVGGDGALDENPFYAKYQRKIQELRKSNPDIFATRMETRSDEKTQPVGHSKQAEFVRFMEEKANALGNKASKPGFMKNKTLDSILNVDMVKQKKPEEIKQIWKQYFSGEDTVYAVIPGKTFDLMWKRAQHCPSFLFALPRKEGYEFFVGQWSGAELHFTSLINIQATDTEIFIEIFLHFPDARD